MYTKALLLYVPYTVVNQDRPGLVGERILTLMMVILLQYVPKVRYQITCFLRCYTAPCLYMEYQDDLKAVAVKQHDLHPTASFQFLQYLIHGFLIRFSVCPHRHACPAGIMH